ncbi:TM2 domain-containing protein [Facklamia sp. DSM 111018]|uniref:TM2 domain-containing protein n=1 Tax=Facklamia lactis TaxID=2749967 RepID=A0ABS0LMQ1_9LACT|nr:TM2 domain-containing protein [Facklamia lactis]MBG9979884.1 TM2 domain-containing protein [Facklamia lactis]MBG9985436.1 TM2 domain-containing protein [Facklamia lactis]
MQRITNLFFIPADEFYEQEKSPIFAGFLCLIAGIFGYHRLYVKHDLRFLLILLLTGIFFYLGFTKTWIYLIGWCLWFAMQSLVYFIMNFTKPKRKEVQHRTIDFSGSNQNIKLEDLQPIENNNTSDDTFLHNTVGIKDLKPLHLEESDDPQPFESEITEEAETQHQNMDENQTIEKGNLTLTDQEVRDLKLYPTHISAINAINVPNIDLWKNTTTRSDMFTHYKEMINIIGSDLASDEELLSNSQYAYLVEFFQKQEINGPMKLALQSIANLCENLILNQIVDDGQLSTSNDLMILDTLLPASSIQKLTNYYVENS